ncbi:MAG: hypothetical protein KAI67_00715 [Candidatus Pacebacteria bacterium]|nr:hypothetical protein [Candidatus Paceibacterota bacterium]
MKNKKEIINVSDEQCFWFCNGSVARNLEDLKNALLEMDKKSFIYHVNKEKNDFAIWVKEILGDDVLANKLKKSKTIKTIIKAIENNLKK